MSDPKLRSILGSWLVRSKRHPDAVRPWRVVLLAVDTARRSGWARFQSGLYQASGELDVVADSHSVNLIVRTAVEHAAALRLPAVLVYELPYGGARQGGHRGTWTHAWYLAGGVKTRTVGVYPAQWRARILGHGMHAARREIVRPAEQRLAAQYVGRSVGPDEAPAILLGRYGSRAGAVGAKLTPKQRAGLT